MILPISAEYRIEGTRYAWEVQRATTRKHRKTGKPQVHWVPILWYPSLPGALEGLTDLRLRLANADNLSDAIREARRIATELGKALAALGKRTEWASKPK